MLQASNATYAKYELEGHFVRTCKKKPLIWKEKELNEEVGDDEVET